MTQVVTKRSVARRTTNSTKLQFELVRCVLAEHEKTFSPTRKQHLVKFSLESRIQVPTIWAVDPPKRRLLMAPRAKHVCICLAAIYQHVHFRAKFRCTYMACAQVSAPATLRPKALWTLPWDPSQSPSTRPSESRPTPQTRSPHSSHSKLEACRTTIK